MRFKKGKLIRISLKVIMILSLVMVVTSGMFFLMVYAGVFGPLPGKNDLSDIRHEEASLVFSADSQLIGKYFAENRTNIRWEAIPDHLKNALVATEDKRYFSHEGIDTRSYLRVFFRSILFGDKRAGGGSTITQQLIKNLYGREDFGFLSLPVNKLKEAIIASRFENIYSKEDILLLYLNSVPFGEDVYGVESAARRYFNKPASELKVEESAVLVGMLKANTYFNPRIHPEHSVSRRNLVLSLMEKEHYLSAIEADSLKNLPLRLDYENFSLDAPAGYFVYQVKKRALQILEDIRTETGETYDLEKDGLKIYTTLNMQVQNLATEAVKDQLSRMQSLLDKELERNGFERQWLAASSRAGKETLKRELEIFDWDGIKIKNMSAVDSLWHYYKMLNAAVLMINPKSGEVVSWVGGNHYRYLPFDMVLSHRQIASAFKPILYAAALEAGFSPCTYLENEVKKYEGYENWEPQNFDHTSTPDSNVTLWYALAHSMNLPTVDLYFKVGPDKLIDICEKLKLTLPEKDVPSTALGAVDVSLSEIVRAYTAFANQGKMAEMVMIDRITDAEGHELYVRKSSKIKSTIGLETSQMITAILQTAINQGTGIKIRNRYNIHADLAGKTGTAQNYSNAWFVAYTPDLVMGTWVGARTPDVHFNSSYGTGSSLALPIIGNILSGLETDPVLKKEFLTSFDIPDEVYASVQCDPYEQKGIKGFINRLFDGKGKDKDVDRKSKKDKKKGKRSILKRLF